MTIAFLARWLTVRSKLNMAVLAFLFWTAIAAIFTTKTNLYYTFKGVATSWIHLSIHHVAAAWTWLVLTPFLWWFYKRCRSTKGFWRFLSLFFAALIVFSTGHRLLTLTSDIAFRRTMGYIDGSVWQTLWDMDSYLIAGLFDSAIAFSLIMTFFHVRQQWWLAKESSGENTVPKAKLEARLKVKHSGSYQWLAMNEIIVLEAAGNYVRFIVSNQQPLLIRGTLKSFESRLSADDFIRVNRSSILNTQHVKQMRPRYNGEYTIVMEGGKPLHTSRKYGQRWRKLL